MGLLNDVSEGVSELIKYGNVGGLIRNVTHGVSNSAAKVRLCVHVFQLYAPACSAGGHSNRMICDAQCEQKRRL